MPGRARDHVGEWRVAVRAESPEGLFAEVARLIAQSGADASRAAPGPWEPVAVSARDVGTLLVDWANELIGRSEVAAAAYGEVRDLRLVREAGGDTIVTAEVRGRPDPDWESPIKAATYHGLSVEQVDDGWSASLLFDV